MSPQTRRATVDAVPLQKDYENLAAFRYALRRFLAFSAEAAQDAGLTVVQHQALLSIKGHPQASRLTIGQLADHLLVAPHTAAELVARLEADGMVMKMVDPADRRRIGLHLTPQAEHVLLGLSGVHLREIREMAPGLIDTLKHLLPTEPNRSRVA